MKSKALTLFVAAVGLAASSYVNAALITFDDAITGSVSYEFDGDGDMTNDVIFSTTDPSGFNTVGPGPEMSYVNEPGLEGTTSLNPDLRVDFLFGAVDSFSFGFALNTPDEIFGVTFRIFDSNDVMLGSVTKNAMFTLFDGFNNSSFPEAFVEISFAGIASYAIFDFDDVSRYLLDNFSGTFGSTEDITPPTNVPEPLSFALFTLGLAGIFQRRRALS